MIIFDFDGVLCDSLYWYEDVCRTLADTYGSDYDELLSWMIEHGNTSWIPGAWSDDLFVETLNDAFSIKATIRDIERGCERSMKYDADMLRILRSLGSATIFTDNPSVRVRVIERTLPVPSRITYSQALGVTKRHGFRAFIERSGITKGVLIDDIELNIQAARREGFEGVLWKIGDPIGIVTAAIAGSGARETR